MLNLITFGGAICDGIECLPIYLIGFGPPFLAGALAVWAVLVIGWRVLKKKPPTRRTAAYAFLLALIVSAIGLASFLIIPEKLHEAKSLRQAEQAVRFDVYELRDVHRNRGFFNRAGSSSDDIEITLIFGEGKILYMVQGESSDIFIRKLDDGSCFVFPLAVSNAEVECEPKVIDGTQVYTSKKGDSGIFGYYLVKNGTAIALKGERLTSEELPHILRSLQIVPIDKLELTLN